MKIGLTVAVIVILGISLGTKLLEVQADSNAMIIEINYGILYNKGNGIISE